MNIKIVFAIIVGFVVGFWVGTASANHIDWYDVLHAGDQGVIVCGDGQSEPSVTFGAYPEGPGFAYECVAVATPTPTPTPIPPTPTPVPPTPTNTPVSGHNNAVWHGPAGNTHEHGAPPPAWLPSSGPCAGVWVSQQIVGREAHHFYKGYEVVTSNGVRFYVYNHVAPTLAGRSHGDHDETMTALDLAGNYSCWRGITDYADSDNPTDPITVWVKGTNGIQDPGTKPIILVDPGLACESWYGQGRGPHDPTTHVCNVWQDIEGNNRGDGTPRNFELNVYRQYLPGSSAIYVAPTFAQSCLPDGFGNCKWAGNVPPGTDFGQVVGPN